MLTRLRFAGCALLVAVLAACAQSPGRQTEPPVTSLPAAAIQTATGDLSNLTLSSGELDQAFQSKQTDYSSTQPFLVSAIHITPFAADRSAAIRINNEPAVSGGGRTFALAIGENAFLITVTAGNAAKTYRVTIDRQSVAEFAQQAYLKASNARANALFGYAVAISGDTLAVGAYLENSYARGIDGDQSDRSADGSGAVYVFVRAGQSWSQQAYIKASNTRKGAQFGRVIALSGNTLAVGSPFESSAATGIDGDQANSDAPESGAVYVFKRQGQSWAQQAYLKASNAKAGDMFGSGLALSGDTLAVGAHRESGGAGPADHASQPLAGSGAVYVFQRTSEGWTQQAYIKASNARAGDRFGSSVALHKDILAVGAILGGTSEGTDAGNRPAPSGGAVYVFQRRGRNWAQEAYFELPDAGSGALFGSSVALSEDTLAVGAPLEAERGAVHIFERAGRSWTETVRLTAAKTAPGDGFGQSVALAGNMLAVGAYLEGSAAHGIDGDALDRAAPGSGAIYVFARVHGTWAQQAYVKASNTRPESSFGFGLAISADTLAVGAPGESSDSIGDQTNARAPGSGAVYVFR